MDSFVTLSFVCEMVADQVRKEITRHREGEFSIQFSTQVRTTKWLRMDTAGVTANPVTFIWGRSCSYGYATQMYLT